MSLPALLASEQSFPRGPGRGEAEVTVWTCFPLCFPTLSERNLTAASLEFVYNLHL